MTIVLYTVGSVETLVCKNRTQAVTESREVIPKRFQWQTITQDADHQP